MAAETLGPAHLLGVVVVSVHPLAHDRLGWWVGWCCCRCGGCDRGRRALRVEQAQELTLIALVGADQQTLRDHVPFDLLEQLSAAGLNLEARDRIESEHLEDVPMRAALPRRRIGR